MSNQSPENTDKIVAPHIAWPDWLERYQPASSPTDANIETPTLHQIVEQLQAFCPGTVNHQELFQALKAAGFKLLPGVPGNVVVWMVLPVNVKGG